MKKTLRIPVCAMLCSAAFITVLHLLVRAGKLGAAQAIPADVLFVLLAADLALALSLKNSIEKTLYSYTNIVLSGVLIFVGVLTPVTAWYFGSSLVGRPEAGEVYAALLSFPRRFSHYALFIISAVSVLVGISNVVLIKKEGFCLHNALSLLMAGFYIGGTVAVYFIEELLRGRGLVAGTLIPLFLLLMLCYFECILAGSAIMGWLAAKHVPAYDKDYIIILGCSIDKRGGLLPLLKGRVNRAIRFAWDQEIATGKPLRYVPSGGQGSNEIMSEGSAMELYLLTRGAEDYEVYPEKKSTSTYENMLFSKRIIDGLKPNAKIAFATTNYHMLRSGILARKAGIDAEGIAGDTKWYFWPNGFVREFFAILTMNVRSHIAAAVIAGAVCALMGIIM